MASLGDAGVQRPARRARSFVSFGRTGLPSRGFDSSPVVDLLSSAARALQPSAVLCSARHGACSVADPARRELGTVGQSGFGPRKECCSSYVQPSVDPMTRARAFLRKTRQKAERRLGIGKPATARPVDRARRAIGSSGWTRAPRTEQGELLVAHPAPASEAEQAGD